MPLTKFPQGVSSFGMPVVGTGEETFTTGNIFFVDSGGAEASDNPSAGKDPAKPFATIDFAIGQCTANNGDIIMVMPGHTEAPATTEGIDLDVAGVWIRGIGWGNDRPTITPANATIGIKMAAASGRLSNVIFDLGATTTVADAVGITAAGCIVENIETRPHATSQYTNLISVTDVEDVVIRNSNLRGLSTGAAGVTGLNIDGADRLSIYGNRIDGFFSEHVIDNSTNGSVDECKDVYIANNHLKQVGSGTDFVIEMDGSATGLIIGNMMSGTQALDANVIPGNARTIENYLADIDDSHGVVVPTSASA